MNIKVATFTKEKSINMYNYISVTLTRRTLFANMTHPTTHYLPIVQALVS